MASPLLAVGTSISSGCMWSATWSIGRVARSRFSRSLAQLHLTVDHLGRMGSCLGSPIDMSSDAVGTLGS